MHAPRGVLAGGRSGRQGGRDRFYAGRRAAALAPTGARVADGADAAAMDGAQLAQYALGAALARSHSLRLFRVGLCEIEGVRDAPSGHSRVERAHQRRLCRNHR